MTSSIRLRLLTVSLIVLAVVVSSGSLAFAQGSEPSETHSAKPVKINKAKGSKKTTSSNARRGKSTRKKSTIKKSSSTAAKSTNNKKLANEEPIKPASGTKLSREIVFDGSNVNGQYHSAGEAVAKVEQEKKMNRLIGIRSDYKDRMSAERERLKRGGRCPLQ